MTQRACEPSFDATDRLLYAMFARALRRTAVLALGAGAVACGRTPLAAEQAGDGTGTVPNGPYREVDAGSDAGADGSVGVET
jgi:hypothetical protein